MRITALREVSRGRRSDSGTDWCLNGQETEPLQIVYIRYNVERPMWYRIYSRLS